MINIAVYSLEIGILVCNLYFFYIIGHYTGNYHEANHILISNKLQAFIVCKCVYVSSGCCSSFSVLELKVL